MVKAGVLCGEDEMEMKTPADVFRTYADADIRLSVSTLAGGMVQIEGDEISLEFLGHLILRHARFGRECRIELGHEGKGKPYLTPQSQRGVCVHRIPCKHTAEKA
jgi:hypothetical protein